MELVYAHVLKKGGRTSYFYFIPIGERGGKIAGLNASNLSDPVVKWLRQEATQLDEMTAGDRFELMRATIPNFNAAYRELDPKMVIEAFTYKIGVTNG